MISKLGTRLASCLVLAMSFGCKGGDTPAGPGAPSTLPPTTTHPVDLVAYYDENGNGLLDPSEVARIPEATLEIGSERGSTEALTGHARIERVPAGRHAISLVNETLPPYYQPGVTISIDVPTSDSVSVPITLPIGSNLPNSYLAIGDSLTEGNDRRGETNYRGPLEDILQGHFGAGGIINSGIDGTDSDSGPLRLPGLLAEHRPAFTLIVYGTNDWNGCFDVPSCHTVDSIRTMVQKAQAADSLLFVATILPTNTGFDDRAPPSRNEWVAETNELIRAMVAEEGAVLMDIHAAFLAEGDFLHLFEDHVHPTPEGYQLMAEAMFEGIARGSVGAASFAYPLPAASQSPRGRPNGGLAWKQLHPEVELR